MFFSQSRRKQAVDNHPDDLAMQKELSAVRPQEVRHAFPSCSTAS